MGAEPVPVRVDPETGALYVEIEQFVVDPRTAISQWLEDVDADMLEHVAIEEFPDLSTGEQFLAAMKKLLADG